MGVLLEVLVKRWCISRKSSLNNTLMSLMIYQMKQHQTASKRFVHHSQSYQSNSHFIHHDIGSCSPVIQSSIWNVCIGYHCLCMAAKLWAFFPFSFFFNLCFCTPQRFQWYYGHIIFTQSCWTPLCFTSVIQSSWKNAYECSSGAEDSEGMLLFCLLILPFFCICQKCCMWKIFNII